ncbi:MULTISPECIES: outer membrane beta-barrel protein [Rhodomicrobium]|uniref:outer membrane protein n=1 Tax=Rhodomicrobium TaxID=1068 RepID=UPI0014832734|nr:MULTISPECIES: outer membrane beta-barrel protein [Rhodomicrobium]
MNAFKTALLGASLLISASAAASAADLGRGHGEGGYKDDQSYYPAITWAGFYAGVYAGATLGDRFDASEGDFHSGVDIDESFTGGGQIGYNWQQGNVVYGIEGQIGLIDDELNGEDLSDYLASVRGRLGYAIDKNLVYGTAGVAFLGASDEAADLLDDDTSIGFVVGGGIERKITENLSFGVESLYYNFSSDSAENGVDIDRDFFTVQARLNFQFGNSFENPLK